MIDYGHSYMDKYPDFFAFLDLSIHIDHGMLLMERSTYSFLDYIGDVGGLTEFLYIFVGLYALKFSKLQMKAELTSSLNVITSKELKQISERILDHSTDKITKQENGNFILKVPQFLDWE